MVQIRTIELKQKGLRANPFHAEAFDLRSVSVYFGQTGRTDPDVAYRIASFIWATMFRSDAAFLARGASLR